MRRSDGFAAFTFVQLALLLGLLVLAGAREKAGRPARARNARLVAELGLTDLALFTEARYTRHPSQADLHSPFQDHPMAMEHFPTGSLVRPPKPWRKEP